MSVLIASYKRDGRPLTVHKR